MKPIIMLSFRPDVRDKTLNLSATKNLLHTVKNAKINSICLHEQSIEWLEPVAIDHDTDQPGRHRHDDDKGPVPGAGYLEPDSVFSPLLNSVAVSGLCSGCNQIPDSWPDWTVVGA